MKVVVLSDLHLGRGRFLESGQRNILEDFNEDEKFYELVDFYCTKKYEKEPVHLILNGDILNLIQIDIEGIFTHIIDDRHTIQALDLIAKGHPKFFEILKYFLKKPKKKLTYVVGNHDSGMMFENAQQHLRTLLGCEEIEFAFTLEIDGIHIEHGHRFEMINTVPKDKYFQEGPNGSRVLNLPWGSLFCISILPQLKKKRPYIDKLRPISSYVIWCLVHDFLFFWYLFFTVNRYLLETAFTKYYRHHTNFKTSIKLLKQITIYPIYARQAKRIFRQKKHVHTVIMGHSHVSEWRRFPKNKYYFNTGTWNEIPSIDVGLHQDQKKLSYVTVEIDDKTRGLISAKLNVWQGNWNPFREEASIG